MLVKFKDPGTLMTIEIDMAKQRKMAHQEFLERRPTQAEPSGFGPSDIFNKMRDDFAAKRQKHTEHLQAKIANGDGITPDDIHAAKFLEVIEAESKFDHTGVHCKHIVSQIEYGRGGLNSIQPTWKSIEIQAGRHKQHVNGYRPRVDVKASHHSLG